MNVKKVENNACGKLVLGIMLVAPVAGQACECCIGANQSGHDRVRFALQKAAIVPGNGANAGASAQGQA